jgi:alpha-glucosidase (family GH31 glycosyl hydrolase)
MKPHLTTASLLLSLSLLSLSAPFLPHASANPSESMQSEANQTLEFTLLPGENWYGGFNVDGQRMPFNASTRHKRELFNQGEYNQAAPLLISDQGRWVWSDHPFRFEFNHGKFTALSGLGPVKLGRSGTTLRSAFLEASRLFFPPQGKTPDLRLFTYPQYNTWIELMYDQEESAILRYAQTLIDQKYPLGVLMIDDNWQEDYGLWQFSGTRFRDPKGMIRKLKAQGFPVMLWVCPFISPDSTVYRDLSNQGLLLSEKHQNRPAMVRWWNGVSAVLDLSNPKSVAWFKVQLNHLTTEYGVDGFKFDAGDADYYAGDVRHHVPSTTANDQTELYARIGLDYPLNEYRAAWKMGGQPLVQRLKDKDHRWSAITSLIPDLIAQGLLGHPFACPDMIGGGEYLSFLSAQTIDQELVVRSAQVHALMPMMQFSVAPWRILSPENNAICRRMAELHVATGPEIVALAKQSAQTGEPIVRSLEYQFPHQGFAAIKDQFLLGPDLLVAPVLEKGARSRKVVFPSGTWKGDDGTVVTGPAELTVEAPLSRLPYYRLQR